MSTAGQLRKQEHRFARQDGENDFARIETMARSKGFLAVSATPMTRSSFHADNGFAELQAARLAQMEPAHV